MCLSLLICRSEPSEKIVMSSSGREAHQALNSIEAVSLSRPPVGSDWQPAVKCSGQRVSLGTPGRSSPSLWTLVLGRCLLPAPLPRWLIGGVIRLTSGCCSSIVCSRIANCSLASSSATSADGRPASWKRVTVGVVLHTGRTPLAASMRVLSTTPTCHPLHALTSSSRTVWYW